ncbi:hypothetical protein SCD_n02312 [Sulfuricella denitrificans skB26]|uniref:Secreted protein n=1 Tax=Sulfuricella denitrificans (strain DSM 22764 / NBRC 105220 / skB26) TaxID=1163617 RepID=S6AAN8_SULDS|nr:hypothetical protein [Sulfuricella denitrificans]BAN36120.1 hypothetical protein SCD_n02312 [Sulfuricella denitrificans skB26]
MFKRIPPYLLLLVLVFSFSQSGWAVEAPNGFHGMTWGTPLSKLTGLTVADDSGQVKYYRRTGDPLNLGKAELKRISYGFYMGKFYSVLIEFEGKANFEKARAHLLATYGETARIGSGGTSYMWATADGASVNLKYSETPQQGYVFLFNRIVAK